MMVFNGLKFDKNMFSGSNGIQGRDADRPTSQPRKSSGCEEISKWGWKSREVYFCRGGTAVRAGDGGNGGVGGLGGPSGDLRIIGLDGTSNVHQIASPGNFNLLFVSF